MFLYFIFFFQGALGGVRWGKGSAVDNVPLLMRGGGGRHHSHLHKGVLHPRWRTCLKCLMRQTTEVMEGQTGRVQRDFGPRCEGARQQQREAAGANEGCAFDFYFKANTCARVAIQWVAAEIYAGFLLKLRDGDGDRDQN